MTEFPARNNGANTKGVEKVGGAGYKSEAVALNHPLPKFALSKSKWLGSICFKSTNATECCEH